MVDEVIEHALVGSMRKAGRFLHDSTGGRTGQRRILLTMLNQEALTQRELQDLMEVRSSSLCEMLAKLEASGAIIRHKSQEDKRQVNLALTSVGKQMALKMEKEYDLMVKKMFAALDEQEKQTLYTMMDRLITNWELLKEDDDFLCLAKEFYDGVSSPHPIRKEKKE